MTLKLLQGIGVFNVNVLFTFLNAYSLVSSNDLQHSHRKSWHLLTSTSSQGNWFGGETGLAGKLRHIQET